MKKDWVRYSVAVYVGLLLAGSLMTSRQASARPSHWTRAAVQANSHIAPASAEVLPAKQLKQQKDPG